MSKLKGPLVIFLLFSLVFLGGCVKRNLHINSDPPGATVYFNEREIGTTPLDYDFIWYATHKIRLEKEGYQPIQALESIKTPLYLWMPLDFFLELTPYVFWDRRELSYTLTPSESE